jgi:hypothetical protein
MVSVGMVSVAMVSMGMVMVKVGMVSVGMAMVRVCGLLEDLERVDLRVEGDEAHAAAAPPAGLGKQPAHRRLGGGWRVGGMWE